MTPHCELTETANAFELLIELPGITREHVELFVDNGMLHLRAHRVPSQPGRPLIRELPVGDFARAFKLGSTIDTVHVAASLERGILRLCFPKLPQAQRRRIPLEEEHAETPPSAGQQALSPEDISV